MMDAELSAIYREVVNIVSDMTQVMPEVRLYKAYQGGFIVSFRVADLTTKTTTSPMWVASKEAIYDAGIMVACEWNMKHPPRPVP